MTSPNTVMVQEILTSTPDNIPMLSLNAKTNGTIVINDKISGDTAEKNIYENKITFELTATDMARENLDPTLQTAEDVINYMKEHGINGFDENSTLDEILDYAMGYEIEIVNQTEEPSKYILNILLTTSASISLI